MYWIGGWAIWMEEAKRRIPLPPTNLITVIQPSFYWLNCPS
jgi:hypothetical protein